MKTMNEPKNDIQLKQLEFALKWVNTGFTDFVRLFKPLKECFQVVYRRSKKQEASTRACQSASYRMGRRRTTWIIRLQVRSKEPRHLFTLCRAETSLNLLRWIGFIMVWDHDKIYLQRWTPTSCQTEPIKYSVPLRALQRSKIPIIYAGKEGLCSSFHPPAY